VPEHRPPPLDPQSILRTLDKHRVRYVLIGGLAAVAHGWPGVTLDADVTPAGDRPNLARLAAALRDMGAKLRMRSLAEGVDIKLDVRTFQNGTTWTFTTRHGPLDVALSPDGTGGYSDLSRDAVVREAFGVQVTIASLEAIIRSKQAAGRSKDLAMLPLLRRVLERSRERET
jgi:hypothetical protein